MLKMIAAVCTGGGIGYKGGIPWRCKKDMQHFRRTTMGHIVLMGRMTAESCHLPGRNVLVAQGRDGYALARNAAYMLAGSDQDIFICGGSMLYNEAIHDPDLDELIITRILDHHRCDRFFPEIDRDIWSIRVTMPLGIGSFIETYRRGHGRVP